MAAWRPDESTVVDVVGAKISVALTGAANNIQEALRKAADAPPFVPRTYRLAFSLLDSSQDAVTSSTTTITSSDGSSSGVGGQRGGKLGKRAIQKLQAQKLTGEKPTNTIKTITTSKEPSKEILKYLQSSSGYIRLTPWHYLCLFSSRPAESNSESQKAVLTSSSSGICVIRPLLPLKTTQLDGFGDTNFFVSGWEPDVCASASLEEMVKELLASTHTQNERVNCLVGLLKSSCSATSQCMLVKHGKGVFADCSQNNCL